MAGFKVTLSEKEAKEIGRALTPPMDVKTFGKLSGGHSGSIYYLEAKDGYRLVVNVGEADEFERFKQLHAGMDLLVKHGASLARPLAAVGIIEVDGNPKSYRVTEFIKGKQINNFTVDQVVELAKQLANIHASTGDFVREHGWMPPKMNMLGQFTPANIETKYQKAKASAKQDEIFSDVLDKAHNELLEASRQHRTGLPVGLRHGDFKGKNLVYKNDNTPIIIDWEHMDCGTLLSEIAFVLCEVAYTGNRFDQKKADAFLEAYNQVRPLRNTEIEALPEWLENASKLHNLIRGIGMGIKFADDKVMPLPSPHDRLVMHKSLEQYTKSTDFSWLVEDNRGIPYEQADKYRRKPKVMIWVESRSGAGHIHRVASSAKELTRNGYDVHVVTSSIQYVKQAGLDKFANIIELPGFLTDQPDYKGSREQKELDEELTVYRTNPLEDISWQQERKNLIINALKDVQPDVFITEEYPMTRHPVYTPELEGALKFIHSNESTLENRPLVFCMIKDIALATNPMIKDPAGGTPETASAVVDKYYDHIYVKGDESVVPIWRTAPYLSKFKDKITHVGYMAHAMDTQRNINIPEQDRDVVIATGGSFDADAMELVKKSIKAHGITKH
jgi:homoserine kinase type II